MLVCSKGCCFMTDIAAGDLVRCIDDTPSLPESRIMPVFDALYTVASVRVVGDGYSVRLRELTPSCYRGGICACGGCGWGQHRFQKVYRPNPALIAMLACETPELV
jgi:hypothetical protein